MIEYTAIILSIFVFVVIVIMDIFTSSKESFDFVKNGVTSQQMYSHLKQVTDELDKNNILYWMAQDTLLSAIRQLSLVPYQSKTTITNVGKMMNIN